MDRIGVWIIKDDEYYLYRLRTESGVIGEFTGIVIRKNTTGKFHNNKNFEAFSPAGIIASRIIDTSGGTTKYEFLKKVYELWLEKF